MSKIFKKYTSFFLLMTFLSCILLLCSVPPVSRDALTHHLAVPELYVQQGGIYELPDIKPSYYPQLLDIIYCIPMMFGNDIVPKYIHFLFAVFTAFFIYRYVKNRLGKSYAFFSVLFFLSLPVIVKLSITVYVDLGLICFSTAALLFLVKWKENNFQLIWLILSAVFCGLALSTKYNGLITFFLLTFFIPLIYLRTIKTEKKSQVVQLKAFWYVFVFLLISVSIFSPWMIKNYIWTQNPVYPLYDNYFNPNNKNQDFEALKKKSMNHFLVRKFVYKETWWETVLIPVRIFFQGEDDNPKKFDGKLNPFLFFLPFFAFLNLKSYNSSVNDFDKKVLSSFSLLYILTVFFQQDMRIRWIGPAIPPLIILSAYGLKNILTNASIMINPESDKANLKHSVFTFLMYSMAIYMLCLNGIYLVKQFNKTKPLPYIFNQITRSDYIENYRPEYAALQYSNLNLDRNTQLLALFLGNRRYYSEHDIKFDSDMFKDIIKAANQVKDISDALKQSGYTDIILNYNLLNTWIENNFDSDEKKMAQDFFDKSVDILFSKGGYGLYHLR